jgi:hypothetical protein
MGMVSINSEVGLLMSGARQALATSRAPDERALIRFRFAPAQALLQPGPEHFLQ